ncbi:bifunctional hydroxymethylpyrimidine kinase/phosphomethylpyrimidine kinase [Rathayibacter toxicus]|uniref:Uncharacterized protein n=1 Tax=Rathayibacter toxicus TaxID=145458 RepID=A0A0C5BHV4_9MICO|nr:hypothetical protein TI83_07715 [Rathayibacter toxicus]ALS57943.1 hypothetical protein APU90_09360 [Rathayibacter toxicus]KKM44339.1 hypothetical protein VT73_10665 [Rathayibacter toxicus]PPG20373.1 bifunctional hydroxymethylpyrimidine kinase/phosphomethylpyrimidine kinase [Rathayibacter toxicus]PPG45474.1 bifunctional hydroxymethylpyrimidine kinase/phosphomethylpyrimidine kinase [Rathayibacter toxicus]
MGALTPRIPRVLSIAGTDPTGGAGIQADLKSIGALGGYGMAVVTALVAQNTRGVRSVHLPPIPFLREQLDAVADDVEIDAVKIGMIATARIGSAVADWLEGVRPPLVVIDPVMISTSGHRLLDREAENTVRSLLRHADLVTPNLAELAVLAGTAEAEDWPQALNQGAEIAHRLGTAVVVKGGHLDSFAAPDAIITPTGEVREVVSERVRTTNTHGTGCSLSSAMATLLVGRGKDVEDLAGALTEAKEWLTGALRGADALAVGVGNGPIDHFHRLRAPDPLKATAPAFCNTVWKEVAPLREEIDSLPFIRALHDGSLGREDFEWYLEQDTLYLAGFARVLAVAAQRAPTSEEQVFWAESSVTTITTEAQLHRTRLGSRRQLSATAVTQGYLDHLTAVSTRDSYGALVAALVPCFWLYADIGTRLAATGHPGHPYDDWLCSYSDPALLRASKQVRMITDAAAARAGERERATMRDMFLRSMMFERDFFAAPLSRSLRGEHA